MLKAALEVPAVISFTVWGFTDADSWVPGFFTGEGYATIYDVNQQPKQAYFDLQNDLRLGRLRRPVPGAKRRFLAASLRIPPAALGVTAGGISFVRRRGGTRRCIRRGAPVRGARRT